MPGGIELLEVVDAIDVYRLAFGAGECRKQHGRKNRENGDDNQQFYQSKPVNGCNACRVRIARAVCSNRALPAPAKPRWTAERAGPGSSETTKLQFHAV